jgi:uncharacterized protein (DUF2062 family)
MPKARKKKVNKLSRFFRRIGEKLFGIKDSPHKIALGFAIGIFSGIFPGTGPIASMVLAFIFRANMASALIGSFATNTWLSFVILAIAVKLGSLISGLNWREVYASCVSLFKNFHIANFLQLSILQILVPVFLGYVLIALFLGILSYFIIFLLIIKMRASKKK